MSQSKSTLSHPVVNYLVGGILMVAGMFVSKSTTELQHKLAEMGLPLDPGKTLAVIGVFLILFPVINIFFVRPLEEIISNRTKELEATFGEAETLRTQMTQLKSDYEQRLAKTEAEAREQIQAQIKEAQELKKQLTAEAVTKVEEMKHTAQLEIENEKKQVLGQLRVHVATLSLQASEKIMKENLDTERNRRLIDDFLATVEVKN